MSKKPIIDLFPLIDDPANLFYSKLKSLYYSFMEAKVDLVRNSRCKYTITVTYPNVAKPLVRVIDIRDIKKKVQSLDVPDDKSEYLYARIKISKTSITNTETTTSGESIPVDEYSIQCLVGEDAVSPIFLDYSIQVLSSSDDIRPLIEEDEGNIYIHLFVCQINSRFILRDLEPEKEDYLSLYKPEIGRHWKLYRENNSTKWEIYSIDSDFEEILIDSSSVEFTQEKLPAPQMAPYIDHCVNLHFIMNEDSGNYDLYVYEKEYLEDRIKEDVKYANSSDYKRIANMKIFHRAEEVLYSGYSWENLDYLFSSIKFRECSHNGEFDSFGTILKREMIFLALSYITGLNIRFFFTDFSPYSCEARFYTYTDSPCRLNFLPAGGSTLLEDSINTTYSTLVNWSYYSNTSYTAIPILQNTLGFSTLTVYDRYYAYNELFLSKMKDGMNLLVVGSKNIIAPTNSGLSFMSRFGDSSVREPSGFKNMISYIDYLPYLYADIGGSFSNSWFKTN